MQAGFTALTLYAVFEVGANAERWCPFGGVEAIWTYAREGNLVCSLGTSNFHILGGVLLATVFLRRAFCGYACPIGAISEWVQAAAKKLGLKPLRVARPLDAGLSLLKYAVLAVVLFFTWRTGELILRGYDPCYALISRHGEDIRVWAYVISGGVLLLSVILTVPFCRWLCPLAAVLNPFSKFGALKVRRDTIACNDCGKCGKACPMAIPVEEVVTVSHARCTGCLDCVDRCPDRKAALRAYLPGRRPWTRAAVIVCLLAVLGVSVASAVLVPLPSFTWTRGEAPAETAEVEMRIDGMKCRGSANLLVWFLTRDDDLELEGYLRLEAWPGPGFSKARVSYDPSRTDAGAIRAAISDPCFDEEGELFRDSPFTIEGYDPFGF